MICKNCGSQIPDDARFCSVCGAGVGEAGMIQPQLQPQKKKGMPAFLIVYLALVAVFIGVVVTLLLRYADKNGPLHGAKVKSKVIWETEELKVTVKGLYYDEDNREAPRYLVLEAKNSGSDEKQLSAPEAAVNSVMVESDLSLSVPAGGKAKGELHFSGRELDNLAALDEIFSIAFILREDNDDLSSDVIELKTGLKEHELYMNTGEDAPQYEENGIIVNYNSLYPMFSDYGPALEFYVENNTDRYLGMESGNVTVNGEEAESQDFDRVFLPETRGYVCLVLNMEQLEENDLLPLDNVSAEFEGYDSLTMDSLFTVPVSVDAP
ncbi:MAG: zinc-ribbon domain-containing protein [Lachnospiraceae bacterium]|nr:zinc-ribbon domain-containing protein [Lachnospiraceae bacterium]